MIDGSPPIGICSCLLGSGLRSGGDRDRRDLVIDELGRHVQWVPVHPEMERPRVPTLRGLVVDAPSPSETPGLANANTPGPSSCGGGGCGLSVSPFLVRQPLLPVETRPRLQDPRLRENFVTRVFAYDRWLRMRESVERRPVAAPIGALVRFHAEHKMLLLAHSPVHYQELGRLIARAGQLDRVELLNRYETGLLQGLRDIPTRGRHVNVLQHLAGFLKRQLGDADRETLARSFTEYEQGLTPLVTPMVLLRGHLKRLGHDWVDAQKYLEPYPPELGLWNHV